jgi:hypothetical protein
VGIGRVIPNGDRLPVRAQYGPGPSYQIGVNPLHSENTFWYTLADLAASKILTGRTPRIERAYRLVPTGTAAGLSPVELLGEVPIDPAQDDFFKAIILRAKQPKQTVTTGSPGASRCSPTPPPTGSTRR